MADFFSAAARRHRDDARHLAASDRFQNAGHLIGFAVECLTKAVLERAGIPIDTQYRGHFPELRGKLLNQGRTRAMRQLTPIIEDENFLQGWRADCRYEDNIPAQDAKTRYDSWLTDVDNVFRAAGIY